MEVYFPNVFSISRVTIIDKLDKSSNLLVKEALRKGATFVQLEITRENYSRVLSQYLEQNDFLIDLTTCISGYDLIHWCWSNGVRYINSARKYSI